MIMGDLGVIIIEIDGETYKEIYKSTKQNILILLSGEMVLYYLPLH